MSAAFARLDSVPWSALSSELKTELEAPTRGALSGTPAEREVDRFLRAHRDLSADQRRACVEAIFGVGLWRRRLAALVGTERWEEASPRVLLDALIARSERPLPDRLAVRASLPDWLERVLIDELGDQAEAFCEAVNVPGPVCMRVQRVPREELLTSAISVHPERSRGALDRLGLNGNRHARDEGLVPARACELSPLGIVLEGRPNVFGLDAYQRGLLEPQDEGSQLLGLLVDAQEGETILDFCAGAGGKTLLLADVTRDRATIYANDPDREKLERLRHRAARGGFTGIRIGGLPPGACDRVLVDAPCSELGALRRGPDLRWRIDPASFDALPVTQLGILDDASAFVRIGGRLVYGTCTIRRAENEEVADAFEGTHPGFKRIAWEVPRLAGVPRLRSATLGMKGFFHVLPHLHGTDGFFAAVFTRVA